MCSRLETTKHHISILIFEWIIFSFSWFDSITIHKAVNKNPTIQIKTDIAHWKVYTHFINDLSHLVVNKSKQHDIHQLIPILHWKKLDVSKFFLIFGQLLKFLWDKKVLLSAHDDNI